MKNKSRYVNSCLSILFITVLINGCGDSTQQGVNSTQDHTKNYHSEDGLLKYANQINPDLVFEYKFDECAIKNHTKDSSQNSLDGTIHNRVELYNSVLNTSYKFNKDSFIELPTIHNNFKRGLTLSSWVEFKEIDDKDKHFIELSNGRDENGDGKDFISFWQGGDKNRIRFQLLNGSCDTQIWANAIEDGLHHYVATYDNQSGEAKIYVDGVEQETYDTQGNPSNHLDQSCINTDIQTRDTNILGGTIWNEYDNGFAGILDETKLFSRPLNKNEVQTIYQNELNGKNCDSTDRVVVDCSAPVIEPHIFTGEFKEVKTIIQNAKDGLINNATYICVGDSTRADDGKHGGEFLFKQIKSTLEQYNVTSYLLAKSGHKMSEFAGNIFSPNWTEAVDIIENSGENTIVDISLGINDVWDKNDMYNIAYNLKSAILKIRAYKPMTTFILTMPDRQYNDENNTQIMREAYLEVSKELNLPLNNTIDSLMPTKEETSYSWYKKDGMYVHLSREGQKLVADFILKNILP